MQNFKQLIAAALVATAGAVAVPTTALAAGDDLRYGSGTDFYRAMFKEYRDNIAKMSAENRAKLMAMQDKLMQMEMDQQSSMMKSDMEMMKMKREIEMFIIINGGR